MIVRNHLRVSWNKGNLNHLKPHTCQCELEVKRIIHLQAIANKLLDVFIITSKVTKSHVHTSNAHVRVSVQNEHIVDDDVARLKRGTPLVQKTYSLENECGEHVNLQIMKNKIGMLKLGLLSKVIITLKSINIVKI